MKKLIAKILTLTFFVLLLLSFVVYKASFFKANEQNKIMATSPNGGNGNVLYLDSASMEENKRKKMLMYSSKSSAIVDWENIEVDSNIMKLKVDTSRKKSARKRLLISSSKSAIVTYEPVDMDSIKKWLKVDSIKHSLKLLPSSKYFRVFEPFENDSSSHNVDTLNK